MSRVRTCDECREVINAARRVCPRCGRAQLSLADRLAVENAALQAECEKLRKDAAGLVKVLEQCITSMLDSGYRADAVVIRAARAAIEKATGEIQ